MHVITHQLKIDDSKGQRRGDVVAAHALTMSAFNEYGIRVGSIGDPTNSREHAMIFKAPQAGKYSIVLSCVDMSDDYANSR